MTIKYLRGGIHGRRLIRALALAIGVTMLAVTTVGVAAASASSPRPSALRLTVASSQSAQSFAAPSGCTAGNVCFWVNANFNDGPGRLSGINRDWSVFHHSTCPNGTWNNCASSVYNNGVSCWAVLWMDPGFGGLSMVLANGTGESDLTDDEEVGSLFNDNISSNSWEAPGGGTNGTCTGPAQQ